MTKDPISLLLVEDNPGDAVLVKVYLSEAPQDYTVVWKQTAAEGREELKNGNYQVVLLDLGLPDSEPSRTLSDFLHVNDRTPIIVLTGDTSHDTAVEAVKNGAQDFILKGTVNSELLDRIITFAMERQALTLSLKESEDRYRTLVENSTDAIIGADEEMKIVVWNSAAERLLGYESEEILGKSLLEIVPEQLKEKKTRGYRNFTVTGSGEVIGDIQILQALHKTGREIPVECGIAPLKSGERWTATAILRDISKRMEAEKEKNRLAGEMHKMQRLESLGILAGGIAHDFNNTLTIILGTISMIREECDNPDTIDIIDRAQDAAVQAMKLAGQLLTFSEGGKPVTAVNELGPVMEKGCQFALSGSGCKCELDIEPDLFAMIDAWQITQVVSNMVMNAAQALEQQGTISVSLHKCHLDRNDVLNLPMGSYGLITISDRGPGITPENIDRIFEPFFTTKETGHGLGLSVCFSIISKHQGTIRVSSREGKGTTFKIYIPLCTKKKTERTAPPHEVKLRKASILIMDDEDGVRNILRSMLEHLGMNVIETSDGEEAVNSYRNLLQKGESIDLVITDLTVPGGMGGAKAAEEILKIDPGAKIIVSSGYSNDIVMANHGDFGFSGTLQKPFTIAQLQKVLREFLHG